MAQLFAACVVFLAVHLVPSTPLRQWARARLGERAYTGLFSLVSIAALAWMITAYNAAGPQEPLWVTGAPWRWATAALMLVAFVLLVAGATSPNPSSLMDRGALEQGEPWGGIFAVTRHPVMWAVGLWALLHLANRADAASALFFGSLALLAIAGSRLQEARKANELGAAWQRFEEKTSFLPLAAIASGRARLSLTEIGWWRLGLAVVLWAALLHFHGAIFGVSPVPL